MTHNDLRSASGTGVLAPAQLQQLIATAPFPPDMLHAFRTAYLRLRRRGHATLICRSSGVAEDSQRLSFAGQFESVANVRSFRALIAAVRRCWASAFSESAAAYARFHGDLNPVMGVLVQAMVDSAVAGVAFSVDPVTGDPTPVVESTWGLGEVLVQGLVTPDRYVVAGGRASSVRIGSKECYLRTAPRVKSVYPGDLTELSDPWTGGSVPAAILVVDRVDRLYYAETPAAYRVKASLPQEMAVRIGVLVSKLTEQHSWPQDLEFAVGPQGALCVVQMRPATVIGGEPVQSPGSMSSDPIEVSTSETWDQVFDGEDVQVVSPGRATGPAAVVTSPEQLGRVGEGDILVTQTTTPQYVPAMIRASGVVAADGGMLSHTAIVSRELGKPCLILPLQELERIPHQAWLSLDSRSRTVFVARQGRVPLAHVSHTAADGTLPASRVVSDAARTLGVSADRCRLARYVRPYGCPPPDPVNTTAVVSIETLWLMAGATVDRPADGRQVGAALAALVRGMPDIRRWVVEVTSPHRTGDKARAGRRAESAVSPEFLRTLAAEAATGDHSAHVDLSWVGAGPCPQISLPWTLWRLAAAGGADARTSESVAPDLVLVFPVRGSWRAHMLDLVSRAAMPLGVGAVGPKEVAEWSEFPRLD